MGLKFQNIGIIFGTSTNEYSNASDRCLIIVEKIYICVLDEIIELNYFKIGQ